MSRANGGGGRSRKDNIMFDALPVGRVETCSQTDRDINEMVLLYIFITMRDLFLKTKRLARKVSQSDFT